MIPHPELISRIIIHPHLHSGKGANLHCHRCDIIMLVKGVGIEKVTLPGKNGIAARRELYLESAFRIAPYFFNQAGGDGGIKRTTIGGLDLGTVGEFVYI